MSGTPEAVERPLRFAVRLPTSNRVASAEAITEVALAAEELGFWAVSVHDHLVFNGAWIACGAQEARGDSDDRAMFEALTTLSFVAGGTSRVRLMTGILLLPVREVILAAKQVATLDALSEGRMVLGVGIGASGGPGGGSGMRLGEHATNALKEHRTFGVPRQRGRLVDEQLAAMRRIWTEPAPSFEGRFVRFEEIEVFPKPTQPGGPPVLVGGSSAAAQRRAATHGDGWLPTARTSTEYSEGVAEVERIAADERRLGPRLCGLNVFAVVAATDREARAIAEPTLGRVFELDQLAERNLIGGPDTLVSRIREYADAGAELIELKPVYRGVPELVEMLRLLADEVMPAFGPAPAGP